MKFNPHIFLSVTSREALRNTATGAFVPEHLTTSAQGYGWPLTAIGIDTTEGVSYAIDWMAFGIDLLVFAGIIIGVVLLVRQLRHRSASKPT